ncbi:MAG: hypothetical protein FJ026_18085, partial [Chloroflexi bacterium]|nr:hypothetical protein [Chloroflexota bacterium]
MPETYVRRLTFLHQGQASNQLLPVYADLGQLDQQAGDWAAALADSLAQHGFPGATDFLRAALKEGKCLLLLDGGTALSVPELARLTELLDTYPKVQVLLATRRKEVAAALADWMCFEPLPFSTDDAQTFVDRRLGKDSPAAQALLQALERSSGLRSLAQNPLLLSTLAWASSSIQRSPLPQTDLYEWCLQVLLEKDRSSAGSQAPSAQDSDTRNLALQEIGYRLHVRRRDSFALGEWESVAREVLGQLGHADKEDDLLTLPERTRLFRRDGDESYAFLRLGLQEFLAAKTVAATGRLSDIVSQYADDPWWHEVIVLAAGQQEGAAEVVSQMVEQSATEQAVFLAARCAAEVPSIAPELKKKLHDGLWQIFEADDETGWQTAAVCIAALSGQRVRDYFQSMLKEGSLGERERAALVMGLVGGSEWATVPLLGALDRTRPRELRRRAAWALGQLGDKRAVPALLETLQDAQEEVANEAAMALGAVGEAAIPVLIQALGSDQRQVRRLAIQALGKVGDKAQRPLVNALQDEKQADETVRGE